MSTLRVRDALGVIQNMKEAYGDGSPGNPLVPSLGIDQSVPGQTNGVQNIAGTSGGAIPWAFYSRGDTNPVPIKVASGQIYGSMILNSANTLRCIKVFDLAVPPTMGSTPATFELPIPAGAAGNPFACLIGVRFQNGIYIAVTSALGVVDNTSAGLVANDLVGVIFNM